LLINASSRRVLRCPGLFADPFLGKRAGAGLLQLNNVLRQSSDAATGRAGRQRIGVLPMFHDRMYQIVLLPQTEVVERACSLREARAWIRAYNEIMEGEPSQAVIAEQEPARCAA